MEREWGVVQCPFGYNKARNINQVDDDYLEWILKSSDFLKAAGQQTAKNNVHDLLFDLKSCSRKRDLQEGRRLHTVAVKFGNDSNIFVAGALINMYGKCGSMVDARRVFDNIQEPDVVSWTTLILGYADNAEGQAALDLFSRMKAMRQCAPNSITYVAAIKACTSLAANEDQTGKRQCLEHGREIHLAIGQHMDHLLQNTLISMYAKCGSMMDARRVFDRIEVPDVVSWTALILGYAENGDGQLALDFFARMKTANRCAPNSVTYIAAIKGCASLAADKDEAGRKECLRRGRVIHAEIGNHMTRFVQNTLINMYAACGNMVDARRVFDSIEEPDVSSCSALIQGYSFNGEGEAALDIFSRVKDATGCAPDSVTYVAAIKACISLAANRDEAGKKECLKRGRQIHSKIGNHMDRYVQSSLISMYVNLGSIKDARQVFDSIGEPNVVSWTALILGYAEKGEGKAALDLFSRMKNVSGCAPDSMTYVAAIKACTSLATDRDEAGKDECLKRCREIHSEIGHHMDRFLQSTLIHMYARFGCMVDARRVFDNMQEPNVVAWTTLILGYADNGEGQVALEFFSRMKTTPGCAPNSMTYVAALKACGSIGALAIGRKFHLEITDYDVHVVTCLVDFYAKCGSMVEGREVFDTHASARNITTWTALLAGYGRFGDSSFVFSLFETMQDQGFWPNAITFVCMLLCCSHAGLVEKAKEYLKAMPMQYGVTPTVMHYNCIVDVLGRANQLDEAVVLLQKMPCNPNAVSWIALLSACRKWKNVEIGRIAFQSLAQYKKNAAAYVLMAQIYSTRGLWGEQEKILETMRKFGACKQPEQAYVMDGLGRMVKFMVGEQDPPEVKNKMKQFLECMKERGYVAESDKEESCGHSERRAVVYGILKTALGEPVRVFKDMRICDHCHWATKMFSKLSRRVIIIRDENWFHVMENGNCSCGE